MILKNGKRELLKMAGYTLGPVKNDSQEIIPMSPVSFGYPRGEGIGWIDSDDKITPNTGNNQAKIREWQRFCDTVGIETDHTQSLEIAFGEYENKRVESMNMSRYKKMTSG